MIVVVDVARLEHAARLVVEVIAQGVEPSRRGGSNSAHRRAEAGPGREALVASPGDAALLVEYRDDGVDSLEVECISGVVSNMLELYSPVWD